MRALPQLRAEQKAARCLQSLPAGREEAGALEWLPPATTVVQGLGFLLSWPVLREATLPWGDSLPLRRALCWCWWPRVGSQLDQEAPTSQGEGSLWPHPRLPTYLHPGASFMAGAGQSLVTERYKCSWAHLRLPIHLHTKPARILCQLLTQLKTLPLVAGRGGVRGMERTGRQLCFSSLVF